MNDNVIRINGHRLNDGIIRAIWCWDSETSEEVLVDLDKNEVIAKKVDGKIVNPDEEQENVDC